MGSMEVNDHYDGSRMFLSAAKYFGLPVDQANFVISQLVALLLATLFRTHLHPSKATPEIRHAFGLLFGLLIGYFCFGAQAFHLAGLPALCYIVMRTTRPEIMHRMVLVLALAYLSCIHLHRQIYDYGSYNLDITGPLMLVTQKVIALAYCIHDGFTSERELTQSQRFYAVRKVPNLLEYFSFLLHFPCLLAGPVLFYKDYMDFIEGTNFPKQHALKLNNNALIRTVVMEPSPLKAVFHKLAIASVSVVIFVKFLPAFRVEAMKEEEFMEANLTYKFFFLCVSTTLVRFKYYFAWVLADAICNNAGIGFRDYDARGNPVWNKFTNVYIIKFEFGTNLRECIEAWNVGTNMWLRMIVYDRVDKHPTLLTYGLSALWHGFYPGYYLTFANGALFTLAARNVRRTVRPYFMANRGLKLFYDALTLLTTRLVIAYFTFSFVLLEFWFSIEIYFRMYLCLHVLAVGALTVLPRMNRASNSHRRTSETNHQLY